MDALLREIVAYLDSVAPLYPGGIPRDYGPSRATPVAPPISVVANARLALVTLAEEVTEREGQWVGPSAEFLMKICEKGLNLPWNQVALISVAKGAEIAADRIAEHGEGSITAAISFGVPPSNAAEVDQGRGTMITLGSVPLLRTLPLAEAESTEGKRILWQDLKYFNSMRSRS